MNISKFKGLTIKIALEEMEDLDLEPPEPTIPEIFTDWYIAVTEGDGYIIVSSPEDQYDALHHCSGGMVFDLLENIIPEGVGLYKLSFKYWYECYNSWYGDDDGGDFGLDIVSCEVIWQLPLAPAEPIRTD